MQTGYNTQSGLSYILIKPWGSYLHLKRCQQPRQKPAWAAHRPVVFSVFFISTQVKKTIIDPNRDNKLLRKQAMMIYFIVTHI